MAAKPNPFAKKPATGKKPAAGKKCPTCGKVM